MTSGVLWICATPIGNREDMTDRARRVLAEADIVACEDTRRTGRLLHHFGIEADLMSYHEHNEEKRANELVRKLQDGVSVVLVSDAGTPAVADPGYRLIDRAHDAGATVRPVPGPSAVTAALSAAGLPTDTFRFVGFLPRRGRSRRRRLDEMVLGAETTVFYERAQRLPEALADLAADAPERPVAVMREMTKRHGECIRGTAEELADHFGGAPPKGECTVVVAPDSRDADTGDGREPSRQADLYRAQVDLLRRRGVARMEAIKTVARGHQVPKNTVYQAVATQDDSG